MKKSQFPFILIGILIVGWAAGNIVGLILAALGLLITYGLSLRFHPRMRHGKCNGSGEHHSRLFPWTHRRCGGCQGGRIIRYGAGHWGAGHIQGEYTRSKAAREAAKENNRWR